MCYDDFTCFVFLSLLLISGTKWLALTPTVFCCTNGSGFPLHCQNTLNVFLSFTISPPFVSSNHCYSHTLRVAATSFSHEKPPQLSYRTSPFTSIIPSPCVCCVLDRHCALVLEEIVDHHHPRDYALERIPLVPNGSPPDKEGCRRHSRSTRKPSGYPTSLNFRS